MTTDTFWSRWLVCWFWMTVVLIPYCLGGLANLVAYVLLRRRTLRMLRNALRNEGVAPRLASFSVCFGSADVHFIWSRQAEAMETTEAEILALEQADGDGEIGRVWFPSVFPSFGRQDPQTTFGSAHAMESGEGITQLLQAEREAATMVTNAKKAKQEKLNMAKVEAQQEIQNFKQELEQQHEEYKTAHGGSSDESQRAVEQQTNATIDKLKQQANQHQAEVVQLLVQYVTTVDC